MAPHLSTAFKNSGSAIGHMQGAPELPMKAIESCYLCPAFKPSTPYSPTVMFQKMCERLTTLPQNGYDLGFRKLTGLHLSKTPCPEWAARDSLL